MSGDVITTIREYAGILGLILATLTAILGGGWAGRGIGWTVMLNRRRRLDFLCKRRARLQELHKLEGAYYGWLLTSVLWVLLLLGVQLAVEGWLAIHPTWTPEQQHVQSVVLGIARFLMGLVVYMIALNRVIGNWLLRRHFDRAMARLDRAIARLKAKQALPPVPSDGSVRATP